YRKEIVEPAKKRDDELLAEQLGRGGGYIKVGDRYVAFGRANLVDEGLKSRSRLPALKKKYEDLRRGAASKEDLRKLAFGISPSKLNTVEDGIFVKALRSGSTPEEFKKRIKDSVTIHKGKDDTLSLEGEAREYQSIKSLHALGAFATTSKFTGEIRREALIESLKGLTSASSKHKRVGAYRDFILTQKAGSQKLLEKRTNMAALLALLSKTGRVPGVYGAWQSDELQRVATTGGVIKANPSIDFNGEKVPLALWTNPKTSKSFMVDARRIGKDGTYSESIRQDDVGDYYYSGFKLPVDLATSSFIKSTEKGKKDTIFDVGRVFLERTGGTKAVASGGGSGIGVVDIRKTLGTFKDTGEISFSSKFLRDEKLPDYTMRERLERAGTTSSAGRFFGAAALSLAGIPAGLAKMGKGVGKGIYEGDIEKIYGSSLFGLTKGVGQTAADLGIVDAPEYGLEAKRTSALYGIAGRGVRGLRGKKDLGGYEATAEGLASTVVEGGLALIPAIGKLGKLGKVAGRGLKSLKTKFGRKALAGLDAAGVQKGTLSKASLEGFAKKYEGVGDLSSLELLKQGRTTAYRAGLRGVSKLGGTGEKIASVLSPRRRLIAERKRALELGLDPSSRFVSRRGYREARKILETGEKTGLSRSRLSQKFISPKKLAGEVLAGKDKFTGRTTRAQRKASEALAKKRGLDLTLAEGKEGLATRQKALIEAGYSKSKRKLTFTRPGSSLLDRIRDLFGRKDSDIKYGGLSTGKQLGFDFDVPGIKAKSKASGVVSGAIDIPSTSLSKTTPIGKTAQRGRVSLSPSFERQVVRSKVAASKTEKFFDSASKKGISREEAAPFLQRYLKGSSLNEIFADLVLARKVRSVGFS
ncbi:MAG: hypothetical protein KAS32_02990, partial [Candidatus Peribacteraceae bacterium]|nr:hypothetical protein [Candidatus Peribacteraceae bacterium]